MKKVYLFAVFIMISIYCLYGQNDIQFDRDLTNEVVHPSPTSAVFRQFSGYTPSLATGTVNVPLPLYDLKIDNYTLPFSLQYYTSGIKVMSPAAPLGYGWSLNPGLRITRTVRGRPDGLNLYPMDIKTTSQIEQMSKDDKFYYFRGLVKDDQNYQNVNYVKNYDSEYDIFTIHLPSGNYSFIIKGNEVITTGNLLKIKVKKNNYLNGFEVTDEYGVVYYFGRETDDDKSQYVEYPVRSQIAYTAWMLRKIKLPGSKSEINFTWDKSTNIPPHSWGAYENSFTQIFRRDIGHTGFTSINYNNEYGYSLFLKQIDHPLGTILFEYQDMERRASLTSFKVKNLSNEVVKQVSFTYSDYNTLLTKALFSDEGVYKFTYNPERFTYGTGQDYWGYYNGKANGGIIPGIDVYINANTFINCRISDRTINSNYMQANILTRVDYPTGGFTEFKYEPHLFEEPTPLYVKPAAVLREGRGLRVKEVKTQADTNSAPVIKSYLYGNSNGDSFNTNGMGHVDNLSTLDSFIDSRNAESLELAYVNDDGIPFYKTVLYHMVSINAESVRDRLYLSGPPIYYKYVTEIVYDQNNTENFKTEYTFSYRDQDFIWAKIISITNNYYVKSYNSIFSKGPKLINKQSYARNNNQYTPVENILYNYNNYIGSSIQDMQVDRTFYNVTSNFADFISPIGTRDVATWPIENFLMGGISSSGQNDGYYISSDVEISLRYESLLGETKTVYSENGEITSNIKYSYLDNTLLLSKELSSSDGINVKEDYSYKQIGGMYYAYPTLLTRTLNGKTEYKQLEYDYGNKFQLQNIKLYKDPSEQWNEQRVTYHNYSEYGKPVYVTQDDGTTVVYIWSYKGQYPVAEIKNATYSEVKEIIPETTLKSIADATMPTTDQLNQINGLRLQLSSAHISTYTYKPLVGMISATDPSGFTTYYSYHSDGRLSEAYIIKDKTKISLEKYEYRFKE